MTDELRTRHRISGAIDENTPRHIVDHPVLGKHLEVVGPDVKPFLPEMHRVSLPEDYTADEVAAARNAGLDVDALTAEADAVKEEAKPAKTVAPKADANPEKGDK